MLEYQRELADSHDSMGILLFQTGRSSEAEPSFRRAIDLLEKLVAHSPSEPLYQSQLASCYDNLASLLEDMGRLQEGERTYDQAIVLLEKL